MVTPAANTERRATSSPFGLMADLGCAFAAQLGMPVAYIARHLGVGVSDETARAAIIRGRRELITRRIDPAKAHQPRTAVPTSRAAPPEQRPAVAARPADPAPPAAFAAATDSIEALLTWAQQGPQRAATTAAKVRVLLDELEQLHEMRGKNNARQKAQRDARRQAVPASIATPVEGRAYFHKVRAWAVANGQPASDRRIVPTRLIRAYEAAHAMQPQQPTDEGDPHRPG